MPGAIKGGTVGLLAAQKIRKRPADLLGKSDAPQENRNQHQPQQQKPLAIFENALCVVDFPLGEGPGTRHHELAPLSEKVHCSFLLPMKD